ncbi:MAG: hypothetical protein J5I92_05775 [Thiogranum sp.]|nr:hypothetical protein [Thiogranum sp.]
MKYLLVILTLLTLTGCATQNGERADRDNLAIEKVDSAIARIGIVTLARDGSDLHVRGTVLRRFGERGSVDGYVHIEALGADGGILSAIDTDYGRMGTRARSASFSAVLKIDHASVTRIRVIHHGS